MITLREYQKEPIRKAIRYFRSNCDEPCLIVLPTAWGKSILTAFVAKYIKPEDKLLVVQPSKELLEQNFKKYEALCEGEEKAGIYSASFGKKEIHRITYATIGSIKEIGEKFKELGYTKMLIDEAHMYPRKEKSMLGKFLKDSGIKQVLGITATPLKLEQFSEKYGEHYNQWSELIMLTNPSIDGNFYSHIIHVGQIQEMTTMGFWAKLLHERIPFDPQDLVLNRSGNEYTMDSIIKAYIKNEIRQNIFDALSYHRERKHCVVYVPTVEEAAVLADTYPDSAYVCGDMDKKRRAMAIDEFRSGKVRVMFNVGVLAVGFDYPEIDMIVLAFSTASVAKYYQIIGRGVRIHPNKKNCLVVDMGGNMERFGKVEDLTYEYDNRWRMYGTGGILLTGMPIPCLGKITKSDITSAYSKPPYNLTLNFGKHRGKLSANVPLPYKIWYLSNIREKNERICNCFIREIENYVRDTTNEPMAEIMPDGQYAGIQLGMIPRDYLYWYYGSKDWNKFNDSLKRGIEYYLPY